MPLISIITVAKNDDWALQKTLRSVFMQDCENVEYIVVDGQSTDTSQNIIQFWAENGLIDKVVSESDTGVYDAMNKGLKLSTGDYVCFMNAGDVYPTQDTLSRIIETLKAKPVDGLLGWGRLNNNIWASWEASSAFKLSSLGFCHQSLYVKRELLLRIPFDDRPFKTDSDTLQLGKLLDLETKIDIIPEIWAIRGSEPGISANLELTKASILNTLTEQYPSLSKHMAEVIIEFRRKCEMCEDILNLLDTAAPPLVEHIALMVLDTLFLRQSRHLSQTQVNKLYNKSVARLIEQKGEEDVLKRLQALNFVQGKRRDSLAEQQNNKTKLKSKIATLAKEEAQRVQKTQTFIEQNKVTNGPDNFVISLTSFPARLSSVHLVIESLLAQTLKPKRIQLWLGKDEIPNINWVPSQLRDLQPQGLEIMFTNRTFYQYDKFMHNHDLNRDHAFIIVDDDAIYPPTSIESLVKAHEQYPNAVIGNRCHLMTMTESQNKIDSYTNWKRECRSDEPSLRLIPTGVGGVLYPPAFFSDPSVTSLENIMSYAPYADDIWLKICALAKNMPTYATSLSEGSSWYHRYTPTMQEGSLMAANVAFGLNDLQLQMCLDFLNQKNSAWKDAFWGENIWGDNT